MAIPTDRSEDPSTPLRSAQDDTVGADVGIRPYNVSLPGAIMITNLIAVRQARIVSGHRPQKSRPKAAFC